MTKDVKSFSQEFYFVEFISNMSVVQKVFKGYRNAGNFSVVSHGC